MRELVHELLKLQAAAQGAHDLALKNGDTELAGALRDIGFASGKCLAKVARTQTTAIGVPS